MFTNKKDLWDFLSDMLQHCYNKEAKFFQPIHADINKLASEISPGQYGWYGKLIIDLKNFAAHSAAEYADSSTHLHLSVGGKPYQSLHDSSFANNDVVVIDGVYFDDLVLLPTITFTDPNETVYSAVSGDSIAVWITELDSPAPFKLPFISFIGYKIAING